MSDAAIIEAAAKAIGQANEDNNWKGIPEDYREWYRELAMCALVKVTPLIRARVLEEAAKAVESYEGDGSLYHIAETIGALKTVDKSDQRS